MTPHPLLSYSQEFNNPIAPVKWKGTLQLCGVIIYYYYYVKKAERGRDFLEATQPRNARPELEPRCPGSRLGKKTRW